jgi:hypothetical protein
MLQKVPNRYEPTVVDTTIADEFDARQVFLSSC